MSNMQTNIQHPQIRFVWVIGSIREEMPDIPSRMVERYDVVLYDRQQQTEVLNLRGQYAQLFCLEKGEQPFTAIADWLNNLSNEDLEAEGIRPTMPPFESNVYGGEELKG